ncbi:Putative ferric-chelate reductase 1 [Larimichthys crocea]|uniref:Uncharacterized protein n=1 Tax=Larimichthys crocea TaxID=215358 RepID=A0ACD3QSC3_LARCR|nr:Putative ferric-chelate reductase 1 [Larimichthys crocea]
MSPVGVCCLLFITVSVCFWVPADCYADGKVTKVCGSMEPHHGVPGQTTQSPFQLVTNASTFSPTDQIQVILSGRSYFEGFLLQARDAANQRSVSTVGTFTLTNPKRTQLLACNKHQGSAVSHTSNARQTEVVVIWNAPADAPRQVQFFVSVVAHYKTFWVKLPGPIIYQHGVTPHPTQSDTTPPPVQTTTPSILPEPLTSVGCGTSKSCLLDPPGCNPKEDPHCLFLSMTTDGPDTTSVIFELSGPAKGYIAFALSWDTWMGDDDVYMCVKYGESISVSAAFFSGRTHPEDETQKKCITGPPEVLRSSRGPMIMKMHGALMLLAWMLTGSVGTFIASFYKPDWPNQTLLGQKVWFQVHRALMMLTVTLTIGAFCLPFFYRKGWSKHAGVHPYLGCCVLALSLIQPIMAMIRPSPDSHSGSHVPRDASVIIAPPTAMGNVCSDWLRDMAGFVQIPPPDGQSGSEEVNVYMTVHIDLSCDSGGGNSDWRETLDCTKVTDSECDLTNLLHPLDRNYTADIITEPLDSDDEEFPHTETERPFNPYKESNISAVEFTLEPLNESTMIVNITDPLSSIHVGKKQLTIRGVLKNDLKYKISYHKSGSTGKRDYISNTSVAEVSKLDAGENYCFMVAAYIPSRTKATQLGARSVQQCHSTPGHKDILPEVSPGALIGGIFISLTVLIIIIVVIRHGRRNCKKHISQWRVEKSPERWNQFDQSVMALSVLIVSL